MSLNNNTEKEILNKLFGAVDFTPPATWYLALSTGEIADDGTGIVEPSGNGYARVAIANDGTNWPTLDPSDELVDAQMSNLLPITFPEASGTWGTITHWAMYDALDKMWLHGRLTSSQTVNATDVPVFSAGALLILVD